MDIRYDKKKMEIFVSLQEKDVPDILDMKELMKHKGWSIYYSALLHLRETILECIKDVTASEENARLSAIRCAVLKGFDNAFFVTDKINASYQQLLADAKRLQEEEVHVEE